MGKQNTIFGLTKDTYCTMVGGDWPSWEEFKLTHVTSVTLPNITNEILGIIDVEPAYHKLCYSELKHPFNDAELIEQNYSQAWQDIFALTMLDGKCNGTYLEIGAFRPTYINNTYLLSKLGYTGISIEIDNSFASEWKTLRPNSTIIFDNFFNLNMRTTLKGMPLQIDYLQLDIDPETQTFEALLRIPHDEYRFSVITYETDVFNGNKELQNKSREFLTDLGYELVLGNVAVQTNHDLFNGGAIWQPFEDWYVDPHVISRDIIDKIKQIGDTTKPPHIFLTKQCLDSSMVEQSADNRKT